jgi:hypothetical protein
LPFAQADQSSHSIVEYYTYSCVVVYTKLTQDSPPLWAALQVNFERCMAGLPRRCDVVFIFGEIDCREGILVAIEKDRWVCVLFFPWSSFQSPPSFSPRMSK